VHYAASEYAADGIRINEVLPGSINTPAMQAFEANDHENYLKTLELIPMRRVAEPIEVARTVVFLCSDDAGYITGVKLLVDGGISL
jgi:NAD(P)-dependent dehydrogenase (short-subunit alcohol dehydrogenase family)